MGLSLVPILGPTLAATLLWEVTYERLPDPKIQVAPSSAVSFPPYTSQGRAASAVHSVAALVGWNHMVLAVQQWGGNRGAGLLPATERNREPYPCSVSIPNHGHSYKSNDLL